MYYAVAAGDGPGIQTAINNAGNGVNRHGQWLASQPRVRNISTLLSFIRVLGGIYPSRHIHS